METKANSRKKTTAKKQSKSEWLKEPPPPEYVTHSEETDRDYVSIGFVEKMLDELCEDSDPWEVENFVFEVARHGSFYFANAHVDLIVSYDGKKRKLSGAKSFVVGSADENKDYSGSALSQCISSAASKLGNRFGRALNGRLEPKMAVIKDEVSTKPKIDIINLKKYLNAIQKKDQQTIDFMEKNFNLNDPEAIKKINEANKKAGDGEK